MAGGQGSPLAYRESNLKKSSYKRVLCRRCFDVGYVENTVHMKTGSTSVAEVVSNNVVPTSGTTSKTQCIRKLDRCYL